MSIINSKDIELVNKIKYSCFISDFSNSKNFEQKIKMIFNHELKEEFQNILLISKELFIDSVKQKVFSILSIKYSNKSFNNNNYISLLSKHIQKLNNKYEKDHIIVTQQFNSFQNEKNKNNKNLNFLQYYFSSYRKHCSNSSNYAIHFCNKNKGSKNTGKFIKIKNNEKIDYLICENCQKVFNIDFFPCYCLNCKEVYFSSQLNKDEIEKNNLLPATLKHTHCEILVNDLLYCPLCQKVLYLNLNNNKIQCINNDCKNYTITEKIDWKCKNCKKFFNSDYKIYNPLEIKILSEEINYSLCIKLKAKPNKLPCCKNIDLNIIDFYHSQKCSGLIYIGKYDQKAFVVCEKCKAINFQEKYIWICPKCKCRFREIKEKDNNSLYHLNIMSKNFETRIYKKKEKDFNEKAKNFDKKKINVMERRKRIFSQEYDYDNENLNDSYIKNKKNNYNDENIDINIIKNAYNYSKINKNENDVDKSFKSNKYYGKKSRNNRIKLDINNLSNNINYAKLKKNYMLNLTSNNFSSERNIDDVKISNIKINKVGDKIRTNLNDKKYSDNNCCTLNNKIKNYSFEKRQKNHFIPLSALNKKNYDCNKYNFLGRKSSDRKRKNNYTPNLIQLKGESLKYSKYEKYDNLIKKISRFSINNEKKRIGSIRNRSPFILKRILNITLVDSPIKEIKINETKNKYNKSKKGDNQQNKYYHFRLKSCSNIENNIRYKREISINSNYLSEIRKSIISLENDKNKSGNKINRRNEMERINIIKRKLNNKKYIQPYKNVKSNIKSKSEVKNKGHYYNEKEKNIKYNLKAKPKIKIKQTKDVISIRPEDIIEPWKIDPKKDIPIINESIKKDKRLYQEIQHKLKKIISKGRLPQFILENYMVVKQLGEGSFGAIFEVVNNHTKIKYAMKKIIANDINSLEIYQKEFEIVHENKHPNILDIHGVCIRCLDTTTYVLYVLMDIAEKDWEVEINERAKIKKYYTEKELISILKQIVNALCFLQKEKNIAHRDIKPENILLFKNNICKIADFGEAKKNKESKFKTLRGTEFYMSPILYKNLKIKNDYVKHNPFKSDIFSLGYFVICATTLNFDIIEKIRGKNILEIKKVFNKYIQKIYSNNFLDLIFKMIEDVEDKRIDFIQLKKILDKEF